MGGEVPPDDDLRKRSASMTFPGAPLGYPGPGDPLSGGRHIPAGIAPTPPNNFSPRFGLAYSPSVSGAFLNKLTGAGKTSIRLGGGRFFTSPQGAYCRISHWQPAIRSDLHEPGVSGDGDPIYRCA